MIALTIPPGSDSPPVEPRTDLDRTVQALLAADKLEDAVGTILRAFGGELLGFLYSVTRRPQDADDAFSVLSLAVWRSLPGFEWRSSLRTWLYVLARRAVSRATRGQRHDDVPLSQASAIEHLAAEVRATSLPHLAPVRDAFAELRGRLDPDDQVLIVLRIDRDLPWRDIALVLAEDGDDVDRVAASLRKRFERVKVRIRAMALEAGLIER